MNNRDVDDMNGLSAEEVVRRLNNVATKAPLARSYWVSHPSLLAGVYPGATDPAQCREKLRQLSHAGIRTFVNLMEEQELGHDGAPIVPYEAILAELAPETDGRLTMQRFPVRDVSVPSPRVMREILDAIDNEQRAGRPVYVHCWGGRGRTGSVIGCWLARHGIATGDTALRAIELLRRYASDSTMPSPETTEQVEMVRMWKEAE